MKGFVEPVCNMTSLCVIIYIKEKYYIYHIIPRISHFQPCSAALNYEFCAHHPEEVHIKAQTSNVISGPSWTTQFPVCGDYADVRIEQPALPARGNHIFASFLVCPGSTLSLITWSISSNMQTTSCKGACIREDNCGKHPHVILQKMEKFLYEKATSTNFNLF